MQAENPTGSLQRPARVAPPGAYPLACLLIALAVFLAYANSFQGPFVLDDLPGIAENPTVRQLWPPWTALNPPADGQTVTGRPLLNLTFALNYKLGAYRVVGYHIFNFGIHLAAALLLFGLVRRTLQRPPLREYFGDSAALVALAATLLWAVHPLQTEAVTYIVQRAESLVGMFYLLTMYAFVRGLDAEETAEARVQAQNVALETEGLGHSEFTRRDQAKFFRPAYGWYAGAVLACLLGMASKEVMVSAPLMALLYDRTFCARSFRAAWQRRRWLYVGLACTWILLGALVAEVATRGQSAGFGAGVSGWTYAWTQFGAITHYLLLSFWPAPLVFDYGESLVRNAVESVPYAVLVLALAGASFYALFRREFHWRALGFLGVWFFAILAPSSSIVPVVTQTVAEHRMYLSLAAITVLVAVGLFRLAGRRGCWVAIGLSVVLAWATSERNHDYRSAIALWSDTVEKLPDNPRGHANLGIAYTNAGHYEDAVRELQEAVHLKPRYPDALSNLGNALGMLGRHGDSIAAYQAALAITPNLAPAHYNLANALVSVGDLAGAKKQYEEALKTIPNYAAAHNNLANILKDQGDLANAVLQYQTAVQLEPGYVEARVNLANLLFNMNQFPQAAQQFNQAVSDAPDNPDACAGLAVSLVSLGHSKESLPFFQRALQLQPQNAQTLNNFGTALLNLGDTVKAIEAYTDALKLAPNLTSAKANLDNARQLLTAATSLPGNRTAQ